MRREIDDIAFEDALSDDWRRDIDIAEVPIGTRPMLYLSVVIFLVVGIVAGRIILLGSNNAYYEARAERNAGQTNMTPAPRGIIYDRTGVALVDNKASFAALLNVPTFLRNEGEQSSALEAIDSILGISPSDVQALVNNAEKNDFASPVVLIDGLTQAELVNLQARDLSAVTIESDFARTYPDSNIFSSVLGYTGRVTADDLARDPGLKNQDLIGKTGIESYYDTALRGTPGIKVTYTNAVGQKLGEKEKSLPRIGASLKLTIDGGLQKYFYTSLSNQLAALGRPIGAGIAIDPRTGEVLSLINLPGYDSNVFSEPGHNAEIQSLFTSNDRPLFDRAISGAYNPGSTIKPLDGVAALAENVIDAKRTIFSPGYLLVPNPYDPSSPSRHLDWQYQGSVNMASALAQSSDVYFYIVGGGSPISTPMLNDPSDYGISGLGIDRLNVWWKKFGLGKTTGIDMPSEGSGFLPTTDWKQKHTGKPWLLGDTYNVSIGQGDLLLTPIQLVDYIGAIANGGKVYRPFLNASSTPAVAEDLTSYGQEIAQVQEGMRAAVTAPKGTAYTLHDLPFSVCAKTGSAQVVNNTQENAFFVGYAPCEDPKIAILILIENSKQGSLNAVPVAKQVLNWYYENRMK